MYKGKGKKSNYTWRNKTYAKKVIERDNFTCKICHLKKEFKELQAHHLNGCNWDIENRMNLSNGVCLCFECHKLFHKKYGYGDNTKEQFESFLKERSETIESIHNNVEASRVDSSESKRGDTLYLNKEYKI